MLEQLDSYTWPTDGVAFAVLGLRVDALASRLGVSVRTWYVDGLGPARGLGFRSASGRVYLLEELELAVQHHGATGPNLYADATEVAGTGVAALVEDVAGALGITPAEMLFVAEESLRERAAALVAQCSAERN
jgi:hypothetical protein